MRIGVDLGGTKLALCLCNNTGEILAKRSTVTRRGDPDGLKDDMLRLAVELCEECRISCGQVSAIGIGVPGSIHKKTCMLLFGTNLDMRSVSFADTFLPQFRCPVTIENDANCAALGEYYAGAGKGAENLLMVTLGTGVGGGIILGGQLYTGTNGIAGEIGHMVINQNGAVCNCGRKGCLEAYASAPALCRQAQAALHDSAEHSILRGRNALSGKIICDAAREGDRLALQVFEEYCCYLACGLANLINLLQPDRIVIGGGLSGCGELLVSSLQKYIQTEQFCAESDNTQIVLSILGNDAGLIGAAMM